MISNRPLDTLAFRSSNPMGPGYYRRSCGGKYDPLLFRVSSTFQGYGQSPPPPPPHTPKIQLDPICLVRGRGCTKTALMMFKTANPRLKSFGDLRCKLCGSWFVAYRVGLLGKARGGSAETEERGGSAGSEGLPMTRTCSTEPEKSASHHLLRQLVRRT